MVGPVNVRDFTADRAICDAATAGPWEMVDGGNLVITNDSAYCFAQEIAEIVGIIPDARFIAEARTGWPAALDRIAELEAEIQRYRQALESLLSVFTGVYVTKNKPSAHVDNALRIAKEALSECS